MVVVPSVALAPVSFLKRTVIYPAVEEAATDNICTQPKSVVHGREVVALTNALSPTKTPERVAAATAPFVNGCVAWQSIAKVEDAASVGAVPPELVNK